jgi:hypothetical protein
VSVSCLVCDERKVEGSLWMDQKASGVKFLTQITTSTVAWKKDDPKSERVLAAALSRELETRGPKREKRQKRRLRRPGWA